MGWWDSQPGSLPGSGQQRPVCRARLAQARGRCWGVGLWSLWAASLAAEWHTKASTIALLQSEAGAPSWECMLRTGQLGNPVLGFGGQALSDVKTVLGWAVFG